MITVAVVAITAVLLVAVIALLWMANEFDALRIERDEARKEANELRIALVPALGRIGRNAAAAAAEQKPAEPAKPLTRDEQIKMIWNSRKPWREKIKEFQRLNNTRQQQRDAFVQPGIEADAAEQAKETEHAAQAG